MERALAAIPRCSRSPTHLGPAHPHRADAGPRWSGVYILSTDVSAEVQSREALAHAARRNLAAQLTSGMAHDFGNLLTIILGLQARLAARDLPPDAAEDVQATLAAARRGASLLDRLAQITGAREPALEPTDLTTLLSDLAVLARPSLSEGTRLDLAVALPPGQLLLDPGALQDSALNLILNANAAITPPGVITLKARRSGDWLELTVGDTGPGFTPKPCPARRNPSSPPRRARDQVWVCRWSMTRPRWSGHDAPVERAARRAGDAAPALAARGAADGAAGRG
ncbi:HAMP domain-containing sensor histidine kinase [Paracoccus marcusii]|nr:HAMP domain-containing sensor histidine kinase [Paracoccus marcusii]